MAKLSVQVQESGTPSGYAGLKRAVAETLLAGQQKLEELRVQIYWQTGKLLAEYFSAHPTEAAHGESIVEKLADDLEIERSVLFRILKFYRVFPKVARGQLLKWSHYRELIGIEDSRMRTRLAKEAVSHRWPAERLRAEILKTRPFKKGVGVSSQKLLQKIKEPERGNPGAAQVGWLVSLEGKKRKVFDLGFANYLEMTATEKKRFKFGDMVRQSGKGWVVSTGERDRWFYTADVERVVDGDSLLVHVHLPFQMKRRQYLRLRGLDAPPISESEGKRAKRWLEKKIHRNPRVLVHTHLTDRYDRYIADVWIKEIYLNQALLDAGLARKVSY